MKKNIIGALLFALSFTATSDTLQDTTYALLDSSDLIYLYFNYSKEPISTKVFLNNVTMGRSTMWGGESKFTRMANSYRGIQNAFKKKDFEKDVAQKIQVTHKPNFKDMPLKVLTTFSVSEYDFDNNRYEFTYTGREFLNSMNMFLTWKFPSKSFFLYPANEKEARKIEDKISNAKKGFLRANKRNINALMSVNPTKAYSETKHGAIKYYVEAAPEFVEIYKNPMRGVKKFTEDMILIKFYPSLFTSFSPNFTISRANK